MHFMHIMHQSDGQETNRKTDGHRHVDLHTRLPHVRHAYVKVIQIMITTG